MKVRCALLVALIAAFARPVAGGGAGLPPGYALGDRAVSARLVLGGAALAPGATTFATVELTPAPGWHLYGPERAVVGKPPEIAWTLPRGLRVGAIVYPRAQRVRTDGLTTYEYHGPVRLRIPLTASSLMRPQTAATIVAGVSWLACSNVCVPGGATLKGTLDIRSKGSIRRSA